MRDFNKLQVWQKAHELALDVYRATGSFPAHELCGLTGQLRRASTSIPINIAEGSGRDTELDFARFLQIAAGSASEVEYELLLARDLGYLSPELSSELTDRTTEVKRMLYALIQRLRGGHGRPIADG
jgi:four helix bundle protein